MQLRFFKIKVLIEEAVRLHVGPSFVQERYHWVVFPWPHHSVDFLTALTAVRKLSCADERDRVYALLGIALQDTALCRSFKAIVPDYNITAVQLYCNVARICIDWGDVSKLLRQCHIPPDQDLALRRCPTWVPDWAAYSNASRALPILRGEFGVAYVFSRLDTRSLVLSGSTESLVDRVIIKMFETTPLPVDLEVIGEFWTRVVVLRKTEMNGKGFSLLELSIVTATLLGTEEYLWHTGVDDTIRDILLSPVRDTHGKHHHGSDPAWSLSDHVHQMLRSMENNQAVLDLLVPHRSEGALRARRFQALRTGRKLFCTSTGHIGLGPGAMQPQDQVALLLGVEYPAILRKQESSYHFIGNASMPEYYELDLKAMVRDEQTLVQLTLR